MEVNDVLTPAAEVNVFFLAYQASSQAFLDALGVGAPDFAPAAEAH